MHYLKRLVTGFSLGALFTMEMAFNATPPANAQVPDQDCILHAVGAAAGMNVDQVAEITGLMAGPTHDSDLITGALRQLGLGEIHPYYFNNRVDFENYLRGNHDAEYIVGWQRNTDSVGHSINARVVREVINYVDNQATCQGTVPTLPPYGPPNEYTYVVWLTRGVDVNSLTLAFYNLTLEGLLKRDETFGNFTSSCKNISLFTNIDRNNSVDLSAECQDNQGNFQPTAIDLNTSIANDFGALSWRADGGFGGSVQNCRIQVANYTVLECDAANGSNGSFLKTGINLDTRIINVNGKLTVRL